MENCKVLFSGKENFNIGKRRIANLVIMLFLLPNMLFAMNGINGGTPLSVMAPIPPTPQSHVQNVFSDVYTTPIKISNWAYNSNATAQILTTSGNQYLQYTFAAKKDSIRTVNFGSINVTSYNFIHVDIYSPTATRRSFRH